MAQAYLSSSFIVRQCQTHKYCYLNPRHCPVPIGLPSALSRALGTQFLPSKKKFPLTRNSLLSAVSMFSFTLVKHLFSFFFSAGFFCYSTFLIFISSFLFFLYSLSAYFRHLVNIIKKELQVHRNIVKIGLKSLICVLETMSRPYPKKERNYKYRWR